MDLGNNFLYYHTSILFHLRNNNNFPKSNNIQKYLLITA